MICALSLITLLCDPHELLNPSNLQFPRRSETWETDLEQMCMRAQDTYKGRVLWKHLCQHPLDLNPTCRVPRLWLQMWPHNAGQIPDLGVWCFTGAKPFHTPDMAATLGGGQGRLIILILWMRKVSLRERQ